MWAAHYSYGGSVAPDLETLATLAFLVSMGTAIYLALIVPVRDCRQEPLVLAPSTHHYLDGPSVSGAAYLCCLQAASMSGGVAVTMGYPDTYCVFARSRSLSRCVLYGRSFWRRVLCSPLPFSICGASLG